MFTDRLHTLLTDLDDQVRLVIDGMTQAATDVYHEFVHNDEFFDESIVNRGLKRPDQAVPARRHGRPAVDADRRAVLDDADPRSCGKLPIIISPSGMLSGRNSPRYLAEFAVRFDAATIVTNMRFWIRDPPVNECANCGYQLQVKSIHPILSLIRLCPRCGTQLE